MVDQVAAHRSDVDVQGELRFQLGDVGLCLRQVEKLLNGIHNRVTVIVTSRAAKPEGQEPEQEMPWPRAHPALDQ